ncbi:MAG: DUF1349 domain-containing protein, partial [Pirellulaceae bacterium]|nr:DUF1349 domain-containing protein [Pirellulaceae bacterium]
LTITSKTASSFSLAWNDVSGESGYVVERSNDGINYRPIGTTAADITTFTDSDLIDAETGLPLYQFYFYRVRAEGVGGTLSEPSSVVHDVPQAGPASSIVVNSISSSQLVIDWQDASGETGYRVERSLTGTGGWTTVGTVGRNVPSFTNSGLTAGTRYFYRIVSLDAGGDAGISDVVSNYTRLAQVSGLTFTTKEPYEMAIQWNALSGATYYQVERSTNGKTYATVASSLTATSYTDSNVVPLGEYYYRVTAWNENARGTERVIFAAAPAAAALPTPWLTRDIGSVGGTGAASYNNGVFTLVAAGAEIAGGADEFRYVYKSISGDFSYSTQVTSVEDTNYWAKAGLMVRESTTASSKHALVYVSPHVANFQWRTATGGAIGGLPAVVPDITAPYYIRISRVGNLFTADISPDGSTWTTIGSRTITMNSTVLIGFALCSRDDNYLNTSTFTIPPEANVAPTVATPAAVTSEPVTGATASLSVLGADDHGEPNLTYTWTATSLPSGASQPTYSVNRTNAAKNTTATFNRAGVYTLRVTITDTSGLATTSTVAVTVDATLTSIAVVPAFVQVPAETTHTFAAAGYDQFGRPMSSPFTFAWNASLGDIASDGFYTAPSTATIDTVTASAGSVQGTAQVTVLPAPLPSPWASRDIGAVGAAGSAAHDEGVFTVAGSGLNIGGTTDEFHFVYRALTGDGRITAKVASIENTDGYAKAGVMMRESFDGNSANVALLVTPENGIRYQYRLSDGSTTATSQAGSAEIEAPYWLRLTREGDTFRSEISPDGTTWTVIGNRTIAMNETIQVGLPVTSRVRGTLCTSVFSDVLVEEYGERLPGDANFSGTVDQADTAILAAHWGMSGRTWLDGDFSGDGVVNAVDAAILAAHFGATLAPAVEQRPADQGILEPAEVALLDETTARDAALAEEFGS